jgi:predicted RNase H-like HicB family nuclease
MAKKALRYTVQMIPAEEGGYWVLVPALESCYSQGETIAEAARNAREAVALYLESLQDRGLPLPEDREPVLKRVRVSVDT